VENLMPCKIGITTNPEVRRIYWQNQTTGFANWQILEVFRSKAAAKEYETAYSFRHGCEEAPGTAKESATVYDWWHVCHFDYTTEKA
jgi:hypothetical protein